MKITEKCDVYNFGTLALEVIKGGNPRDYINSLSKPFVENTDLEEMILDHRLWPPSVEVKEEIVFIVKLASRCLNKVSFFRPGMQVVAQQLSRRMNGDHP
ncbi:unnamed protein product [Thlaspi arvense]|uniref:non-specific serine/threonine protein kinase n=1 Tax=Thlaspi arvense TaxID=13288 RepID=A0AAU9S7C1_THLAR|nr:unnamed protein product [Thlaspi arvense]